MTESRSSWRPPCIAAGRLDFRTRSDDVRVSCSRRPSLTTRRWQQPHRQLFTKTASSTPRQSLYTSLVLTNSNPIPSCFTIIEENFVLSVSNKIRAAGLVSEASAHECHVDAASALEQHPRRGRSASVFDCDTPLPASLRGVTSP